MISRRFSLTRFDIRPPYDFRKSLHFSAVSRFEKTADQSEAVLRKICLIGGVPVELEIRGRGTSETPIGEIKWRQLENGKLDKSAVVNLVRRILGADLYLEPFYRLAEKSQPLHRLAANYRGLKPILTTTLFEAAAWAIMGQQVNLAFAATIKERLVKKCGRRFSIDGVERYVFPGPEKLAEISVADLKEIQFSARKAEYLIGLSRRTECHESPLESISSLDYSAAVERLLAIRGIGVWSANYILLRGAGHLDCLPLGDSGLHRAAKAVFGLKSIPGNRQLEKLARPFLPYRSLFTLYLWFSLIADKKEDE